MRTEEGEEHSLEASGEHWTVRGPEADLQIMDTEIADGKLRRRQITPNPDVQSEGFWTSVERHEFLRKRWARIWPARRAAFLARVEEALKPSELDLSDLNLTP